MAQGLGFFGCRVFFSGVGFRVEGFRLEGLGVQGLGPKMSRGTLIIPESNPENSPCSS